MLTGNSISYSQLHAFFIGNTFINNTILKLAKNQANAKQQPETKFCYLKIIHILHAGYHPKITIHILKKKKKIKCVLFMRLCN